MLPQTGRGRGRRGNLGLEAATRPSPFAPGARFELLRPRAFPPPSLGRGWVLAEVTPLLPSANPQGPGSMETVRLVQNMCKIIFFFFYKQS